MEMNQNQQELARPNNGQLEQLLRRFRPKSDLYRYMDRNLVSDAGLSS